MNPIPRSVRPDEAIAEVERLTNEPKIRHIRLHDDGG